MIDNPRTGLGTWAT